MSWLARAQDGVTIFLGVIIEATPFLLLGVLVRLMLAPGTYELRMQVDRDGAGKEPSLRWTLTCQPASRQLLDLSLASVTKFFTGRTG